MEIHGHIDMTGWNRFKDALILSLVGTGQDGDFHKVVKSQAGLLAWEISAQIGPSTKQKGQAKVNRDVAKEFSPGPDRAFDQSKRKPKHGETGITWLYAGPSFLVGVRDADLEPQMETGEMKKKLDAARAANFPRGKAWVGLGKRGRQHVQLHNRTIVSKDRYFALVKAVSDRIGRLRATFASAAEHLGKRNIPKWIKDLFPSVRSDGAAIFEFSGSADNFNLAFGSRAPGVMSNPTIQKKIHNAVHTREHKMEAAVNKLLAGYTYDWNTGRVFRRNRGEEMMKELETNAEAFENA